MLTRKRRPWIGMAALAVSLAGLPSVRAEQPRAYDARGGVERELTATASEMEQLEEQLRRIDLENNGMAARRAALHRRARAEARWLYHLVQARGLALWGGPGVLLDHVARADQVRRAFEATMRETNGTFARARVLQRDRAQASRRLDLLRARQAVLARRRDRIGAAEAARASAGGPATMIAPGLEGPTTVYGGAASSMASATSSFAEAAGRLLFPIAGRVEVQRANREGSDGPGVEVTAARGSPVRTVHDGRVAFADRYGSLGRIVIVDHGEHYYTVSGNLGAITVTVGEEVRAGTVLGTVGDDGRGPMLYFEVRHGTETIDPGPWLGL